MSIFMNTVPRTLAATLLASVVLAAGGAVAQTAPTESRVIQIAGQANGAPRQINLSLNKAAIVELDRDARDVVVANPTIVDAVVRTPRRIFIMALKVGQTNAIFLDATGRQIASLEVNVGTDVVDLNTALQRNLSQSDVRADSLNDTIVISGQVNSLQDADKAQQLATRAAGAPERVVNALTLDQRQQVLIKVRVSEMSRTIAKQLGVNVSAVANAAGVPIVASTQNQFGLLGRALADISGFQAGQVCQVIAPQDPVILDPDVFSWFDLSRLPPELVGGLPGVNLPGQARNGLGILPGLVNLPGTNLGFSPTNLCQAKPNNLQSVVQALERVGLVHTLAEPNLTAVSGEAARFLAGGEFPVPAARDRDGNIMVEFKPFGVGLGFRPIVLSDGRISLQLSTEVSELTNTGALTLDGGSFVDDQGNLVQVRGLTLPALSVRRAETTVDLPSGGSLAIGGLIQQQTKQSIDAFPGLKELPVLGALFRSRDFQNNETELVITVTAYLVNPVADTQLALPTQGFGVASDLETVLLGRLNKVYSAPGAAAATATAAQGNVGFIVE
jgi:pilus assembly protein CpaC